MNRDILDKITHNTPRYVPVVEVVKGADFRDLSILKCQKGVWKEGAFLPVDAVTCEISVGGYLIPPSSLKFLGYARVIIPSYLAGKERINVDALIQIPNDEMHWPRKAEVVYSKI